MPWIPGDIVAQVFVFLFIDTVKKEVEHGVDHGSAGWIEFQVGLGDVGCLMGTIDQNVIPGLIAVGLRLVRVIPGIGSLTGWIRVNDETTIAIGKVAHDLTGAERRSFAAGYKPFV